MHTAVTQELRQGIDAKGAGACMRQDRKHSYSSSNTGAKTGTDACENRQAGAEAYTRHCTAEIYIPIVAKS
jgi:hypothetical protein